MIFGRKKKMSKNFFFCIGQILQKIFLSFCSAANFFTIHHALYTAIKQSVCHCQSLPPSYGRLGQRISKWSLARTNTLAYYTKKMSKKFFFVSTKFFKLFFCLFALLRTFFLQYILLSTAIKQSVCHCQSLTPQPYICRQGWSLNKSSPSKTPL